jgi:hypothetical protein
VRACSLQQLETSSESLHKVFHPCKRQKKLHISELAKLRDNARESKAWSAAVNAEVARGKAAGLYVEQKIIRTGSLTDLTAEQLENRMKEIIQEYSPILEGVVVDDLNEIKSNQLIDEDYSSSESSSSESSQSESSESEESHSH